MSQNEIKMMYDVLIADIEVGERKRSINSEKVTALMQSIKAIGLQTPITLYGWPDDQKPCTLVAGLHRLEAVKRLGRDAIPAFITQANEIDREIWEIDENLQRADLTAMERDEHLARRAELFDARGGEKIATPGGKQKIGFAKDTAAKTGMSKSAINKAIARAQKITAETMKAIKGTPAGDKGVELDALASMEPEEQSQAVERVKSGASKDFREAKDFIKGEEPTPDSVEGLYHLANDALKMTALMPEKERKAWKQLIDNWAKTLPKSDRKAAKVKVYAFLEWWSGLPEKQRYKPYGFRWSDSPVNHPSSGTTLHS